MPLHVSVPGMAVFCSCKSESPSMLHVVKGDAFSKDPVSPALIDENHRDEAGGGDGHDGQGVGRGSGVVDSEVVRRVHIGDHEIGEERRKNPHRRQDDGGGGEGEGGNRPPRKEAAVANDEDDGGGDKKQRRHGHGEDVRVYRREAEIGGEDDDGPQPDPAPHPRYPLFERTMG